MLGAASPAVAMAVFLLWNTLWAAAAAQSVPSPWCWGQSEPGWSFTSCCSCWSRAFQIWDWSAHTLCLCFQQFIFLWQLWYFFLIYLLLLILVFLTVFHILFAFLTNACFTLCRNFKQIDKSFLLLRCSAIIIK